MRRHTLFAVLIFSFSVSLLPATCAGTENWSASGLLGKSKNIDDSEPELDATDISGIACKESSGYPRVCLVIDDETRWVQIAILRDKQLIGGDRIHLNDNIFNGKAVELDGEAVAYDESDGSFYIAGSHGRPRHEAGEKSKPKDEAKAQSSRQIFRVQLPDVDLQSGRMNGAPTVSKPSSVLREILKSHEATKDAFDSTLPAGGLSVEGMAIRGPLMYVGLRQPVGKDGAVVLALRTLSLFESGAADAEAFHIDLEKSKDGTVRGVRDLVPYGENLLVLAGPEQDPPEGQPIQPGDYSIYKLDPSRHVSSLIDIDAYGVKAKPEALLPLEAKDGQMSALLLFDGVKQGGPKEVRFAYPK